MLMARAGDGSMRDAQSAFDQVIAFAGETIVADDVATVLGLVRRDLLFDIADAVAREDGAAALRAGRPARSSPATTCGSSSASWRASRATCSSFRSIPHG